MEVHVDSPGGLRRQLRISVPAERVSQAVGERLKRYASRAKLPGFRPGKAPFKVIEQQFGDSARMDAISDIVNQTYPEAISKAGIVPAGQPRIDITAEKSGEALEYVAHIEVYPEVKLAALDSIAIEKPVVEIAAADVDKLIGNLRRARRELVEVTRASQTGRQAGWHAVRRLRRQGCRIRNRQRPVPARSRSGDHRTCSRRAVHRGRGVSRRLSS
jgi:trigger factor